MMRTMLNLECDHCGNPYPACGICPSPVDGAIFSALEVRTEAKKVGWTRQRFDIQQRDLCPRCTQKQKKAAGK